jgi:hypothetical protein
LRAGAGGTASIAAHVVTVEEWDALRDRLRAKDAWLVRIIEGVGETTTPSGHRW